MRNLVGRARVAGVAGATLVVLSVGVVAGAAGGNFILGAANSAGTSNSSLTTSSTGTALLVTQNGTGTALRGSATGADSIAGFFTSANGPGISGVTANKDKYAVYAGSNASEGGSGAALRASGGQNIGAVVTSANATAVVATATGCTGFLCGSDGVLGTGVGFGAGVYGTGGLAGVWGANDIWGVFGSSTATDGVGIYGSSSNGIGVKGEGLAGGLIDYAGQGWFTPGGAFTGANGLIAQTDSGGGIGVVGIDNTADTGYGIYSMGDAFVAGDLAVNGTCTGCTAAALAVNGSSAALHQGDAVTLLGVRMAPDGSVTMTVGPAKKGDRVIGVVDRGLTLSAAQVQIGGTTRKIATHNRGNVSVVSAEKTVPVQARKWMARGRTVAADAYLRVITSGVFTYEPASDPGLAAGDSLAVDAAAGKLGRAPAESGEGTIAGIALGKLKDGRIAILVQPR